jgi:hypothetical protein
MPDLTAPAEEPQLMTLQFRFAKTMADLPHWYVVRSRDNEQEYVELFQKIGEHGVWEQFQGKAYLYYYPGDGYRYWRMTNDLDKSQIINRAAVDAETQHMTA